MKTNTKIYVKTDKEKDGKSPVYCRITFNNTATSFSVGQMVNTKRWSTTNNFKQTKDSEERKVRLELDKLLNKIEETADTWLEAGKNFTAEMIKNSVLGDEVVASHATIDDCFKAHKETFDLKISQRELKPNSYKKYKSVKTHLDDFIKEEYKLSSFLADNLDEVFFNKFNKYLYGKIEHNQVIKYCVSFRRVLKEAVSYGLIKSFPFKNEYKPKKDKIEKVRLTVEELREIENKNFETPRIQRVKDCFLFCCYTGLSFADLDSLKAEHINNHIGKLVIEKEREKTGMVATIPIDKAAIAILKKYENDLDCIVKGKLLPVISNTNYNLYLKEIQEVCKIKKNLTTHVARHTFATIALNRGVDVVTVKEALGHSRIEQTLHYAKLITKTSIKEFKKLDGVFGNKSKKHLKVA